MKLVLLIVEMGFRGILVCKVAILAEGLESNYMTSPEAFAFVAARCSTEGACQEIWS